MSSNKMLICLVLAALVGCATAQILLPHLRVAAGAHDATGGYYDNYSGQYSSAITGRVYNTVPAVAVAAHPAVVAAPAYAHAPVAWVGRR